MKLGNGWNARHSPHDTYARQYEWEYWHDENDYLNQLEGRETSKEACLEAIKDIELEHPYFNEEK